MKDCVYLHFFASDETFTKRKGFKVWQGYDGVVIVELVLLRVRFEAALNADGQADDLFGDFVATRRLGVFDDQPSGSLQV